jgi:hypothetical protein
LRDFIGDPIGGLATRTANDHVSLGMIRRSG